jgi:hypothetical protein
MIIRKRPAAVVVTVLAAALGAAAPAAASSVIVSPLPGTPTALPQTEISFLGAAPGSLGAITVVGSTSGRHGGHLRNYSSAAGASFRPNSPFTPGEHVTVHATVRNAKGRREAIATSFTIATPATISPMEFPPVPGTPADVQNYHSAPEMHPPTVTIHQAAGTGSAPGFVFTAPFLGPGQWGPMITDSNGGLVWFRQVPAGDDAADFRTQAYRGKNDLTWWQGRTLQFGYGQGEDVIVNANYHTVAVVKAGNGLLADEHEFLVTPKGSAWVLAYSPVQTSLATVGGPASGIVLDGVIQEIDVHTGRVMWEWHSLGHVDLSESYSKLPGVPTNPFDYFHINSLDVDAHGNILISARNTWALYDINHHTGAVSWRLGGKRTSFTLGAGVPFAFQHNGLWLGPDEVSLFDDEGAPPVNPPSRGEIVKLNTHTKTATLVAQIVRTPGLSTGSQGNTQALPGGGWMIGWGGLPNFTEFNSAGAVIYDGQLPKGEFSYRTYRLPWSGQPTTPPSATAIAAGGTDTVYASWNGATTVASWQLLTGSSASKLSPVSETPRSGFETTIPAPAAAFYAVRAMSASGKALGTSAAVASSG